MPKLEADDEDYFKRRVKETGGKTRKVRWLNCRYRPGQEETKTPSDEYVAVAREVEAWILEHHPPTPRLI